MCKLHAYISTVYSDKKQHEMNTESLLASVNLPNPAIPTLLWQELYGVNCYLL